jgi:C4-type Zn-finger protein
MTADLKCPHCGSYTFKRTKLLAKDPYTKKIGDVYSCSHCGTSVYDCFPNKELGYPKREQVFDLNKNILDVESDDIIWEKRKKKPTKSKSKRKCRCKK